MGPKRVFILGTDKCSWSIDRDRENTIALFKEKTDKLKITSRMFRADIIYCVWYDLLNQPSIYKKIIRLRQLRKKVIAVITNDVRNAPEKLDNLKNIVDGWIAPNSKVYDYVANLGLEVRIVPFLIDKSTFIKIDEDKAEICKKLEIDKKEIENRLLIGSFQRDSLGTDLSKPKWQKNPDLLVKILQKLPKDRYLLILAGPRRHYLINQCNKLGLPYLFIGDEKYILEKKDDLYANNLPLKKINLLYNLIDLYLTTSKSEGGPKAVLESALTKTLIFSTDVGLASDILHPNLIFSENKLNETIIKVDSLMKEPTLFQDEIEYNYKKVLEKLDEDKIIRKIIDLINSFKHS
ncbi:MAG: glycosyltransferase [Candidatus Hermodarchaeota archaeon]